MEQEPSRHIIKIMMRGRKILKIAICIRVSDEGERVDGELERGPFFASVPVYGKIDQIGMLESPA